MVAFDPNGSVAPPQVTPSPGTGNLGGVPGSGAALVPIGALAPYAASTPPTGWLICDGAPKLTADYPALFNVIGYTHGGSGANFNLPDLRDRLPIGASGTKALGAAGGSATKTPSVANMPAHTHTHSWREDASGFGPQDNIAAAGGATGTVVTKTSAGSTGSGTAFDVMNPWRAVNFIIKY